jgi:hypothetical protein
VEDENLAKYYLLYGDINLINTEIDLYPLLAEKELGSGKKYLSQIRDCFLDYIPTGNGKLNTWSYE